jgi:hypothetical protein
MPGRIEENRHPDGLQSPFLTNPRKFNGAEFDVAQGIFDRGTPPS